MMYSASAGNSPTRGEVCKRDLQRDAKNLKERIEAMSELHQAMAKFIKTVGLYWFDNHSHRDTAMVIVGGLSLEVPQLEKEYDLLLQQIEKEQ